MVKFIGFSSANRKIGTAVLEDRALARRDLENHFYTNRGERLGNPAFGSILPTLIFDPATPRTYDLAEEDIQNIIDSDPRWRMDNFDFEYDEHNITITLHLQYVPDLSVETLILNYRLDNQI